MPFPPTICELAITTGMFQVKTSAAVQDAGWQGAPLMCSRQDQKPRLKGVVNGREDAYSGPEGSTSFFRRLLCLRNMLLKSIVQL